MRERVTNLYLYIKNSFGVSDANMIITCSYWVTSLFSYCKEKGWCINKYHSRPKETTAHARMPPGLCSPSKHKHLVHPMITT